MSFYISVTTEVELKQQLIQETTVIRVLPQGTFLCLPFWPSGQHPVTMKSSVKIICENLKTI